jgi:phage terminase small subunit
MGKRGPKSVAELTVIRSARHAHRPAFADDPPSPPAHLSPETKDWWNDILEAHPLASHELRSLQAAGEAWDRCQQARVALAEHGLVYTDAKGMVRARPEVAIERDARVAFLRAVRELKIDAAQPQPQHVGGIGWMPR